MTSPGSPTTIGFIRSIIAFHLLVTHPHPGNALVDSFFIGRVAAELIFRAIVCCVRGIGNKNLVLGWKTMLYVFMCVCASLCVFMCVHACMCAYVSVYMCTCVHVCVYICMCVHVCELGLRR